MNKNYILHKIVQSFIDDIESEKASGREYHIYELLEEWRKFYAYWQGLRVELEYKRKPLRATIYEELRKTVKTQKDAEMQAECDPTYQEHIRKLSDATKISLQAYAFLSGIECKIEIEKRNEIANHIARKQANADGYGS